MNLFLLQSLDYLIHFIHLIIIVINLTFWIFPKTRKIHLVVMGITWFSWLVVGYFYGWGYCFLTDWHWQVKTKLGETQLPYSYLTYLSNNILGFHLSEGFVYGLTMYTFIFVLVMTLFIQFLQWKKRD